MLASSSSSVSSTAPGLQVAFCRLDVLGVGDDAVLHAAEVVVDRGGGLLGLLGLVHAGAEAVLEGGAALGVVAGGGPAGCGWRC